MTSPHSRPSRPVQPSESTFATFDDESARRMAADVERWCRGRWLVMWETYRCMFTAYLLADPNKVMVVDGKSPREVWQHIVAIDPELFRIAVEALPAHPTAVVRIRPDTLGWVLG